MPNEIPETIEKMLREEQEKQKKSFASLADIGAMIANLFTKNKTIKEKIDEKIRNAKKG